MEPDVKMAANSSASPSLRSSPHVANHAFSSGLPSIPRRSAGINDVPVMFGEPSTERVRDKVLSRLDVSLAEHCGFQNISWLRRVTHNNIRLTNSQSYKSPTFPSSSPRSDKLRPSHDHVQQEWAYDDRRRAQSVLPFLYLGPASAAKDEQFLRDAKITMVLLIRDLGQEISKLLVPRTAEQMGLDAEVIEVRPHKLMANFARAIDSINKHLADRFAEQERRNEELMNMREEPVMELPGKVLIYDLTGNEAAAAVVGAYIVAMYRAKAGEAVFAVQGRRYCVQAQMMQEELVKFEEIMQAKRDIGRQGDGEGVKNDAKVEESVVKRGRKREGEEDDASMLEAIDSMTAMFARREEEPPLGGRAMQSVRRGLAPFADWEVDKE